MEVKNVTHMNAGDAQYSYATYSVLARAVILEALPFVDDTVKAMFTAAGDGACSFSTTSCFRIVDLGCSSGPNTVFAISHILNTIEHLCGKGDTGFGHNLPQFEVFFNDLPDNDFNNLFKLLHTTFQNLRGMRRRCSWYGLPGSFYDTLFPSNTIHFAFSSYSLHWLSQVPEGVDNNNKGNIYIARETPPLVFEAYAKQYQRDFATFLCLRSKEIVRGGYMVLILRGRRLQDYTKSEDDAAEFMMLARILLDMVAKGRVKMDNLHSFNVPTYFPCKEEVEAVILDEGSFNLHKLEIIPVNWEYAYGDPEAAFSDQSKMGKLLANCVRAYMEPMLASHFGNSIVDEVFERFAEKSAEHMSTRKRDYCNIAISLCRR